MAPPVVFEISITNGDRAFNPGCFIAGKVVVQTTRRKKLVAIRLLLHGNSYVNPFRRGEAGDAYEGQVMVGRHLECKVDLWGGHGGVRLLEPGWYQFPFVVNLPQVSLPTSFESTAGAVRYWLEARMEKMTRSYTAKKVFIIQERMDLNIGRENLFLPRSGEGRKTFRTISGRSGPLILAASVDRGGYCAGEKILVSVRLDNTSNKEIKKVKASLLCRMTYFRQYRSHAVDTLVSQLRMCQPINAGRHEIWAHHPLPIPAAILPSSHTSKIIHTNYILVVKASTPALSEDVSVTLPIVIGTEPLRPQWQSLGRSLSLNPRYEAPAVGNEGLGTFARRETWAGLPSYSLLPMASVGTPVSAAVLPEPDEPPPLYTPYPTSEVGPPTHSQSPQSADHPNTAASPTVSATPQVTSPASPNIAATPQVSSSASPSVSAEAQVSSLASPTVSATPQVTSPASPNIAATPQVSSSASPSVSAAPQVSSPASPTVSTTPQVTSPTSPTVSATPQVTSPASPTVCATPQVTSPASPTISATPQVSSPASPTVSTTPQVTSPASPTVSATPQVTSPASPTVSATPQVTSPASPNIAATPQVSLPASPSVSTTSQVSSTTSPSISAAPQVSSPTSPTVSATPQVTSPASPNIAATPQVSLPASPSVSATPQVSSTVSPNISATPQISSAESCITKSHPVFSFPTPNATLRVSLPPHVIRTAPQVSPGRPHVSSNRSQIVLERPPVQLDRPRRTASLSATSGRRQSSHRSEGYTVLAQYL